MRLLHLPASDLHTRRTQAFLAATLSMRTPGALLPIHRLYDTDLQGLRQLSAISHTDLVEDQVQDLPVLRLSG